MMQLTFNGSWMRKLAFLLLFCFSSFLLANDVSIKTITQNGKTVYMVQAGSFLLQKDAEALQQKFKDLGQPILIYHPDANSPYVLQIGPLKTYTEARQLQSKVQPLMQDSKVTVTDTNVSVSKPPAVIQEGVVKEPTQVKIESTEVQIPTNTAVVVNKPTPVQIIKEPAIPKGEEKIWNLRNADIRAVIAEVSRITGKNFLIDPRVQGKISIISSTPMSDKELYQAFLSMLQVSGYAAIPNDKVIKIIPNIEAKTHSPDQLNLLKSPPRGDEMMVQVIPVHYVPAEQLVPVLRPLMPQWSSVSAYAPSNMLILSGRANNIRQLASIIKQVDTSSSSGIDMVPLQHALAMDVVNTLKDLVKGQPGGPQHNQTTLAADDRNNSVLISGSQTDRLRLRILISKLDKEGPFGSNSNTQVIYLNYLRAEDLVPILAGIAQSNFSGAVGTTIGTVTRPALDSTNPASSLADGSSSSGNTAAANMNSSINIANPAATPNTTGASTQNEGSTKPTVQIIAEPNTNSIIINGPATLIRTLKKVITQLDIKPAQILIEALVAEINERDFNSLGIEWGSRVGEENATFRPGFAIINSSTSLDQFQAQIYALAQDHRANILSTPSVVVLDNRQAKILIGKQVSVASSSYPNNAQGTGPASPYTTFDRVNVALHLYVRPQITRGKGIQMQIDQGNDTLDAINATTTNPIFNISAIVTSVHVESGNIIVLGGLMQDGLTNDNTRVPILGDIPGVGRLFQHQASNRDKKILMVFIRPLILQTECDALQVTGSKYADVRQYQLQAIRQQDYDPRNNEVVLPGVDKEALPKPFCNTAKKQIMATK